MKDLMVYDSRLLGVCAYLAEKLSVNVKLIRVGWLVATVLGIGYPVLFYFLAYFIINLID